MRNKKLMFYNWAILISFVFLGCFIGGDLRLLIIPLKNNGQISLTFAILFFLDNVFSIGLIVLLAYLFGEKKRILSEQASTKEYFQNEHFVYTETAFIQALAQKAKRKKLRGVVACVGIKNLNRSEEH